jgi:hypothetical protein
LTSHRWRELMRSLPLRAPNVTSITTFPCFVIWPVLPLQIGPVNSITASPPSSYSCNRSSLHIPFSWTLALSTCHPTGIILHPTDQSYIFLGDVSPVHVINRLRSKLVSLTPVPKPSRVRRLQNYGISLLADFGRWTSSNPSFPHVYNFRPVFDFYPPILPLIFSLSFRFPFWSMAIRL